MKKMIRALSVILVICLCAALLPETVFASGEYEGKTVVLFTGDIRGNVEMLPLIAAVRADFESRGADVIVVDTGNFLQGTIYSAFNSGSTMITLMIAAGYDVVALGTYDFAFGTGTLGTAFHGDTVDFGPLGELLEMNPTLRAVASNVIGENEFFHSFAANATITTNGGMSIGFFGLTDPLTADRILETNLTGIRFIDPAIAEDTQTSILEEHDVVIGLSNTPGFGIMGTNVPIAMIIDNETFEWTMRDVSLEDFEPCAEVAAAVEEFRAVVHAAFPQVGRSEVLLDGSVSANRGGETNLGNFWADALRWFAVSGEINAFFGDDDIAEGNDRIHVPAENVVAIWNAGNLRDFLYSGDVTVQDLRRVLPFPNTVAVVYLTGAELLEQLEASSQGLPYTPETFALTAAFMHVSGIEYTIDTTIPFNAGEAHMGRIWHQVYGVERVSITSINGNPFDETAIYAVITSNANFNGMDISYVLAARPSDTENRSTITTARVVEHAVMGYILSLPYAAITAEHASLDGRIRVLEHTPSGTDAYFAIFYEDVCANDWFYDAVKFAVSEGYMAGADNLFLPHALITHYDFVQILYDTVGSDYVVAGPYRYLTRGSMAQLVYRKMDSPPVSGDLGFADTANFAQVVLDAILFVSQNGIMLGVSETEFAPDLYVTRAMAATVLMRLSGE